MPFLVLSEVNNDLITGLHHWHYDCPCAGEVTLKNTGKYDHPQNKQVLELMQMHPKERLRRVILIASRYSTGLKLENYYFFTFTFSWPEVGKLFHIYFFFTFSFSWPEVGKLFHIYFFTFSQTEVGKLFRSYVFTFSRPEVGKLFHISMAKCKTAVTPLLIHWSYCSLALSHQNME